MTRRTFFAGSTALIAAAQTERPAPSTMGLSPDCFGIKKGPRTALEHLEAAWRIGAGGVQAILPNFEPDYLKRVRQRAEELGIYLEITTPLPGPDTSQFERTLAAAKEAGARCIRSVCLSGRRYENFDTLESWQAFVADSEARLGRAAAIAARLKIPVGIENHKDWTVEEMVPLMRRYAGEHFGVCLDWGNNMSLLDDPVETVDALAPFIVNSHIKDMAVAEYEDGFLLAEAPLGQGMLDLPYFLKTIRRYRPDTRFSLDMLTRNPLKITCLTEKYWRTFPSRNGRYLARTLAMVRAHKPARPLVRIDGLSQEEKERLEEQNVRQCLDYARDHLGLRPA